MKNQKGFSLVELLVVIAIIGVLMLLSFPLIDHFVQQNNQNKYSIYRNVIEESAKEYMSDLGFLVSGCYEIKNEDQSGYAVLEEEGFLNSVDEDCKDTKVYVISDSQGKITDYKINLTCNGKEVLQPEYTSKTCDYEIVQYKEGYFSNGDILANEPELNEQMIPVKYDGKDWVVADPNNLKYSSVFEEDYSWYNYNDEHLANAVYMKFSSDYVNNQGFIRGKKIDESDVESWWVWIPRFEYQGKNINYIKGKQEANTKGYKIHPAFTTTQNSGSKQLSGFWINKNLSMKDQKYTIYDYLEYGIGFSSSHQSHVVRDIEWDAASLINSKNITGLNNMDTTQFTGGNYGGSTRYAFNQASAYISYTTPTNTKYINDVDCHVTGGIGGISHPYTYDCSEHYKVCSYDRKELFPTGIQSLSHRICDTSKDGHNCTMTNSMVLTVTANGYQLFSEEEKKEEWYKYLDIYEDKNYSNQKIEISDVCSKTAFYSPMSGSYEGDPSTWVFRNREVQNTSLTYTVTYETNDLLKQMQDEFLNSNVGHTTNMNGKSFLVTAVPSTDIKTLKYDCGTRIAMYS